MTARKKAILVLIVFVATTKSAIGEVINVDFGPADNSAGVYVGTAAAPDLPTNTKWNGISATGLSSGLYDSANSLTGVTLNATANGFYTIPSPSDYSQTGAPALVDDQMYSTPTNTATVVIDGLSAGNLYSLYLYEDRGDLTSTTNFRVTDHSGTSAYVTSTPDNPATTGFNTPEDYVLFSNLTPTSLNQLTIEFTAGGGYGAISGLQLGSAPVPVPEPASMTLLLLGLFALLRAHRHQQGRS